MNKNNRIEISSWTIINFFLLSLAFLFIYYIRDVVALIFIMIILVAGLSPFVNYLTAKKIPKLLSVIIVYLCIFLFLSFIIYLVIPPLVSQINVISTNFDYYSSQVSLLTFNISELKLQSQSLFDIINQNLSKIGGSFVTSMLAIFGSAASAITVMVLTFYILLEQDSIEKFILTFVPRNHHNKTLTIYRRISSKLGNWMRGQALLAIIIGFASYIVLSILGIKYALALAVLAGILEIIPIIGPILAGITALIVAYFTGSSWITILLTAVSYLAIQQLENQFLVPKIMGKAVGLSPIIIIIALMIGAKLGGVIGAVLAIPVAAAVSVVVQQWSDLKKID